MADWQHLYVVYRVDRDRLVHSITIKEILPTEADAAREVARLNELNDDKQCEYSFQCAKYFPDGRR